MECTPRCGGCKCGKCLHGAKDYSLKEEKELHLIENSLEFDETEGRWIAAYPWIKHWTKKWICIKFAPRKYDAKMCLHQSKPVAKAVNAVFATIFALVCKYGSKYGIYRLCYWFALVQTHFCIIFARCKFDANPFFRPVKDPSDLPNNRRTTQGMFASTKKRLARNPSHAKVYQEQIQDMVDRGVARKLTREELETYQGSIHYVAHHEVLRPDSKSTPVRIIFNSGAKYMGHTLNEYWAKGPDLLNSLLGILIRLRENEVAFMGDIKKMYHSVKTPPVEQHTHRFLWRDMNVCEEPDTYVIQRVSFGDKPSATIATVALRKTAQMRNEVPPEAAKIILENTYMDDIIDSVRDKRKARSTTRDIEKLIDKGRFKVKGCIDSKDEMLVPNDKNAAAEKVLGVAWNPVEDKFCFKVKLYFSERKKKLRTEPDIELHQLQEKIPQVLTKRMILSQVNGIYDPLGLAGPFYCLGKNGEIQSGTNVEYWYWTATQKNIADWLTRGKRPEEIDRNSPWQKGPGFAQILGS